MAKGEEGETLEAKRRGSHNALERGRIRTVNRGGKTRRVALRKNFEEEGHTLG